MWVVYLERDRSERVAVEARHCFDDAICLALDTALERRANRVAVVVRGPAGELLRLELACGVVDKSQLAAPAPQG